MKWLKSGLLSFIIDNRSLLILLRRHKQNVKGIGGLMVMEMNGIMNVLYRFCQWVTRLVYLNLLWGAFIILGLGVFGFFPATTAMFAVIRKWIMGDTDNPVMKTFWTFYKKEFMKSNLLGMILCLTGYMLYMDYYFLQGASGLIKLLTYPLILVILLFLFMLLYVIPISVHYEITTWKALKTSLLFVIMHPFVTITMAASCYIIYLIMKLIPGLIPLLGGSIITYILMAPTYYVFRKNQQKQETAYSK